MRKSPNVAVGRAASDATTAEPSVFVAGSLASQTLKAAGGCMYTHQACIFMPHATNPRARHHPIFYSWTRKGRGISIDELGPDLLRLGRDAHQPLALDEPRELRGVRGDGLRMGPRVSDCGVPYSTVVTWEIQLSMEDCRDQISHRL